MAVGGPGTFVTQQAATKAILENANYADLAKQYDPTDTLGLAMSVLLPGAFGALAMRGAAKSVKAKGVPPDTAPVPDAPAAPKDYPDADLVDAARVSLVRQHMDAANPMPDNVETAGAHNAAYSQALDQVAAGERVAVADVAPKVEQNLLEWGARETAKNGEFVKADYKLTDSQPIYQMREMSPADLYLPELDSSGKLQPEKRGYLPGYIERAKAGEIPPAITAIEMEDGRIRVVDGHRRAMAAKEAGNTIRVLVSTLIDTPAGKVEATAENIANNPIADWGAGLNRALKDMAAAAKAAEEIGARIDAAKQTDFVEVVAKPNSDFVQAKSDAGLVGGHVRDGALHITTAEVDPAYRGQGEGIKLYIALVDDALAKGQRVFSDSTVEASAVRMYEALQRRGYEVKRLEGGSLEDGAAYGKGAKEPAFEVVGKTIEGRQGSAADASIPARDGQAAADASGFNPAALAADAARFLEGGKSAAQVIGELEAGGAKASPELQNMLIGVAEFGGRINELADQVSALKAQRGAGTKPFELVAQAVENMRTGTKVEAPKPKTPTEARFADLQARNPDVMDKPMQFDVDENGNAAGPATTAREYLERIQREADQDTADASLIEVAANCFLSGGM